MTIGRILLFETLRGRFASRLAGGLDEVGVTKFSETVMRRLKPQIVLYFLEDAADVATGYTPVDGRISFRLMDHTTASINPVVAATFAQRVNSNFVNGGGFVWRKGREMASYSDWKKGYQLQLLVRSDAEGRRVVEQVLDIQNDTPDWEKYNYETNAEPAAAFPTIPSQDVIYGKSRRLPRRRPVADVRFQYAALHVEGVPNPVILVDRSGVLPAPLVS